MTAHELDGLRVAIIGGEGLDIVSTTEFKKLLSSTGAFTEVVSVTGQQVIQGINYLGKREPYRAERLITELSPDDCDGIIVANFNALSNLHSSSREVLPHFLTADHSIAAFANGVGLLLHLFDMRGRRISIPGRFLAEANQRGVEVVDKDIVCDQNLLTTRVPHIPPFELALVSFLGGSHHEILHPSTDDDLATPSRTVGT